MKSGIRAGRGVRALLAAVALIGVFAVPAGASARAAVTGSAGGAGVTAARASAAGASCADVLFVGARGSGEAGPGDRGWKPTQSDPHGLGPTMNSALRRLTADLAGRRTIQVESVSYVANGVQTLVHAPNQYFANLGVGVTWTLGVLGGQARKCPAQQIVLAGFSQGAMVMHRVLHELGATGSGRAILARVAAAILVGDGDQVPHDNEVPFGSAGAGAEGIGHLLPSISHTSSAKFPPGLRVKMLRVCYHHDPVCDATEAELNPIAFHIHLSYPGGKPLLAAADQAALDVRDMPGPRPVTVTAYAGRAMRYQLRADVAAGFTLQWKAASGAGLPPGLALSRAGLISGTTTALGTYPSAVLVRAVRAKLIGPWLPVTVTTTVTVMPAGNWKAAKVPLVVDGYQVGPVAISCPTVSFCVAAGNYAYDQDDYAGSAAAVATWSGGAWSVAAAPLPGNAEAPPPGIAVNGTESYLNDISCPTVNYCVAVGQYTTDTIEPGTDFYEDAGLLLTFSGGSWAAAEAPAGPSSLGGTSNLLSVSCPSASFCAAVGDTNVMLTSTAGSWQVAGMGSASEDLYSVSCGSPSYCMAGDYTGVATWSNRVWKQLTPPAPAGAAQPSDINGDWVDCTAAGQCVVYGEFEDEYGYNYAVYGFAGGSWTVQTDGSGNDVLRPPACLAVDDCVFPLVQTETPDGPNPDYLWVDAGGNWTTVSVVPPAGAAPGNSGDVVAVACPTAAERVGVGMYTPTGSSSADAQSMFVTFTP